MLYVIRKSDGTLRSPAMYPLEDATKIVDALNHALGAGSYYFEAV